MTNYQLTANLEHSNTDEKNRLLGLVSTVLLSSPLYSTYCIGVLRYWIIPAIEHEQLAVFTNIYGRAVGYISWAHLADDTESQFLQDSDFLIQPPDWNEGGRTWIIDICFPCGGLREAIKQLKEVFVKQGIREVHSTRKHKNGVYLPETNYRRYARL